MNFKKTIKQPINFNQSKNLINASYLAVISVTLLGWNEVYKGNLSGFSIPSLLALLAFGFMWVHYLSGFLKTNFDPNLDTSKTFKISQRFVLLAIIAHPIGIILHLNNLGLGNPPSSLKNYAGTLGYLFISLGTISLFIFLSFELKKYLKSKPKVWNTVLKLNDLAMLLIIAHGFKLGFVINSEHFKYVWLLYGLSLLFFYYDKYVNKKQLTKYIEVFIISLVFAGMLFISFAISRQSRVKNDAALDNHVSSSNITQSSSSNERITLEQLNKSNGLNGNKCLVAVDGNVYDASSNEQWRNGEHGPSGGQAKCGEDLSSLINQSPHGKRVLNKLPVIGILNT